MSHTQNERTIILISAVEHLESLEGFLHANPVAQEEYVVIALDRDVEYALVEKGIPFSSGGHYRGQDASAMTLAEEWTASALESTRWSFFSYRGVSLSRLYFLPLHWYLSHVIYYADIIANVLAAYPKVVRLVAFTPLDRIPAIGSTLVGPQVNVLVDVVTCIAKESGKDVLIISPPGQPSAAAPAQPLSFKIKRALFVIGIGILNVLITHLRRPRRIRALASDYWKNLKPYVNRLDSLEIVLVDRKEALNAGLSNIWRFRMRFLHLDAYAPRVSSEWMATRAHIKEEWEFIQQNGELPMCEYRGFSLRPLFVRALDTVVEEVVAETLKEIDDAYALFERIKPDIVLLRATMSTQTHFVILAQVARMKGVPSLEVQHGLEYYGTGSHTRRHSAQYMGVYGSLTQKEMSQVSDTNSTPVVIGSPRFDVYNTLLKAESSARIQSPEGGVSFLCIAPAVDPGGDLDTYEYEEYFSAIASALNKIPNATAVIKFRPGRSRDAFARRTIASLFSGIPHTIAETEPLVDLFRSADVVISCFSTVAIEAIQGGKPLVYLGLSPAQRLMGVPHFSAYAKQGAVRIATTEAELIPILEELARSPEARAELVAQSAAFLMREYAFDGRASERTAELVRSLVAEKR